MRGVGRGAGRRVGRGVQPRASGLGRVLSDPLLAGYPLENVTVLSDGDATRDNLVRGGAGVLGAGNIRRKL